MTTKESGRDKAVIGMELPLSHRPCSCGCGMYRFDDSHGDLIGTTVVEDGLAKAEFIIQACNSYKALLAAVKAREDEVRHARDCHSCSPGFSCTEGSRLFLDALRLRREALAQVDASPQYPPPPLNQPEVG